MTSKPPIHLSADRDPWERQPGESHRQYARFQTFLELGRLRTLTQTAEMLHAVGDQVAYRTLKQYAYQYRWTERAEAHDREQDRLERQRLLSLRQEMRARHRNIATGLTAKAIGRLRALKEDELTPLDVVRFVRLATQLERAALGEPEQTVAVSGPDGGPIAVEDFSRYSPDERRARLEAIAAELGRRAKAFSDDDDE